MAERAPEQAGRVRTPRSLPVADVNSWIRIRAVKIGAEAYRYVAVEQDINTLSEEIDKRTFNADEIKFWYRAASSEFDTILGLYFQDNGSGEQA